MRRALAIWAGCALIAAWCIVRAWDHIHRPPLEADPWATLPQPDPYVIRIEGMSASVFSDNLTAADDPPLWWSGWQTSRWN